VLVEEAVPPEDLDAGALKEELSDAERRLSESESGSAEWSRAVKDKQRAETFLRIAQG
jgi:F0F1-type ATP synthase epsilon subunit